MLWFRLNKHCLFIGNNLVDKIKVNLLQDTEQQPVETGNSTVDVETSQSKWHKCFWSLLSCYTFLVSLLRYCHDILLGWAIPTFQTVSYFGGVELKLRVTVYIWCLLIPSVKVAQDAGSIVSNQTFRTDITKRQARDIS